MIDGITITPLPVFDTIGGNILHGMKASDEGFSGFGEVYFSTVEFGAIKGWRRHSKMTMNIVAPVGKVHLVFFDDRKKSPSFNQFQQVIISSFENYSRITVPPLIWMSFKGLDEKLNIIR